jgi:methionine synthase I (cobalamin-dependent)
VAVTDVTDRAYDTDLLDTLSKRVVVGDGAIGTQLQAADLTLDDFNNFGAGADAVETKCVRLQSG